VVDLSAVSFMDAATISVIIRAIGVLRGHARSLCLRDPSSCARLILGICALESLIEPDVDGRVETRPPGALAGAASACERT
jgi:anti-anti-sigma regulatory factor